MTAGRTSEIRVTRHFTYGSKILCGNIVSWCLIKQETRARGVAVS